MPQAMASTRTRPNCSTQFGLLTDGRTTASHPEATRASAPKEWSLPGGRALACHVPRFATEPQLRLGQPRQLTAESRIQLGARVHKEYHSLFGDQPACKSDLERLWR